MQSTLPYLTHLKYFTLPTPRGKKLITGNQHPNCAVDSIRRLLFSYKGIIFSSTLAA